MTHNSRYGRVPLVCIVLDMQARSVSVTFTASDCCDAMRTAREDSFGSQWNRILTIFDPFTASHNQGQQRLSNTPESQVTFGSA
jgi:hypothetical protein